jgi:hypothetical protein
LSNDGKIKLLVIIITANGPNNESFDDEASTGQGGGIGQSMGRGSH